MKKLINPNEKIFQWGPIDGRPIYPDYWGTGSFYFNNNFKPGWPLFLLYIENGKFTCFTSYSDLYSNGEEIFKKFILDDEKFAVNYCQWNKMLKKIKKHFKRITSIHLKKLNAAEFYDLYKKFNIIYGTEFWNIGSLPEMANWGGERMLSRGLKKFIKDEKDFNSAFEKLSAPEDFSFYQAEELALLKIKQIKSEEARVRELKKHQEKYFWLLNSYHHTEILGINYFKKIIKDYSLKEAKEKYRKVKDLKENIMAEKNEVIKKFKLPGKILKISKRLAFCIWWQDLRKAHIFQANHFIDIFLQEISERCGIDFDDLHYYTVEEIEKSVLSCDRLSENEIKSRRGNFLAICEKNQKKHIMGSSAKKIVEPYFKNKETAGDITEFKGIATSRGKIGGIARVIYTSTDMHKLRKGEILVTPMTSPDYIVGLRKAGAIITDHGGMTCHAAIVSRELKIPCIVGTRVATRVLKDGDVVEVDADKGLVKVIKQKAKQLS